MMVTNTADSFIAMMKWYVMISSWSAFPGMTYLANNFFLRKYDMLGLQFLFLPHVS